MNNDMVPSNSNEIEKNIYREIGYYFFHKNMENKDMDIEKIVEKTFNEVKELCIHKVELKDNFIYITTEHPGVVIGERGNILQGIENYLKKSISFDRVRIIEERNLPDLYSFVYVLGLDDEEY